MSEGSKYDFFLNELGSLEKQVDEFVHKFKNLKEKNQELNAQINHLKNENEILRLRNEELEDKLKDLMDEGSDIFHSLSKEERINFKKVIDGLIANIDYHLRS